MQHVKDEIKLIISEFADNLMFLMACQWEKQL